MRFTLQNLLLVTLAISVHVHSQTRPHDVIAEHVPVYTAKASVAAAAGDTHSVKVSLNNTHEALQQALAECEAERQAAMQDRYCEPVSVDGEPVVTAAQLRAEARAGEAPKLSLFRYNTQRGTVYLYGSVHLMKRNAFPLHSKIMAAFAASDTLVLEVNLDDLDPMMIQSAFLDRGRYAPDEAQLNAKLSEETLSMAKSVLQKRGLSMAGMNSFRPWFFELTLLTQEMQLYGFDSNAGIDTFFDQKARAAKKTILQLETFDQQLKLMSGASEQEQEVSLRHTLESLQAGTLQTELNALVVDWMEGDIHGLFNAMSEPMKKYPELQKFMIQMFDDRNVDMAAKISDWIVSGGDYFVVVGAGHLGGPNGIVNLLQEMGQQGEQVTR